MRLGRTREYMKAPFLALGARKGAFMYSTRENHGGGIAGTGVVISLVDC